MKRILLLGLFIISTFLYSQEEVSYQNDSIYKVNNVKYRKQYEVGEESKKILSTTNIYDNMGRLVTLQLEPFVNGPQVSTYYFYDNNSKLINIVDSTIYGKPDKKKIKELKKLGIEVKTKKNKNHSEFSRYSLEYNEFELKSIIKYNSDNSIDKIDKFENDKKKRISFWYRNGSIYRTDTCEFERPFHYIKYYGCKEQNPEGKFCWNYFYTNEYDPKGLLLKRCRFENKELVEEISFFYNEKGLLIQQQSKSVIHSEYPINQYFEYEYY